MSPLRMIMLLLYGLAGSIQGVLFAGNQLDTTLEQRASAYIAAFNTSDTTTIRNFLQNNFTTEALRRVPVAQRLGRFGEMRENLGTLTLQSIRTTNPGILTAVVMSGKEGRLTFLFEAEDRAPHRLTGIRVEKSDDADASPTTPAPDLAALIAATEAMVDSFVREDRFSGVVLIARNDSVLLERAGGFADRERKILNTPETRFNLGSINKNFTRVAIHQLEASGKLSLSDTIGKFLPDYPNREAAATVTIGHLLEMQSGIPDYFGDRFEKARKEEIKTLRDYLPLFADKPLEFAPGSSRRYSNGGYVVLGLIIEKVTGKDYYAYIHDNVFMPAGMQSSAWHEKSEQRIDMARGYTSAGRVANYDLLPQKGSSAGGGYSTARDLLRYTRAIRQGKLRLPGSENGLGIAGGAPGLNAALEMDARRGFVIVVLSNFDPPSAESIARTIRGSLPVTSF